jgi:hypothetical protein
MSKEAAHPGGLFFDGMVAKKCQYSFPPMVHQMLAVKGKIAIFFRLHTALL